VKTTQRTERLDLALSAVVWFSTLAFLFWPFVVSLAHGATRYFEWDVPEQYWPDLVLLCRNLHAGEMPYWSELDRGGYAYYADPQAAPYHPLNWAICAVAGPSPSMHWATGRVILGFLIAMMTTHFWLRRSPWTKSEASAPLMHSACAVGAALFATAPFMRHNWELNLTLASAWMPLVLAAIDALLEKPSARHASALALSVGLVAWTGSPPALWLSVSFAALYFVVTLLLQWIRYKSYRDKIAITSHCALAAALTALLTLVILLPGALLSARSVQADHTFASIADGALSPAQLRAFLSPQPGNHLYIGPLVLLGLLAGLSHKHTRKMTLAMLVIGVLAVLLTLGDHTPLFRLAYDFAPGVSHFRLPHRYEAWLGPSSAMLFALGVSALRAHWPAYKGIAARWGWVPLVLAAHLALVSQRLPEERHSREGALPCASESDALHEAIPTPDATVFDEFALGCRSGTRMGHRDFRGYQDPLMLHAYERMLAQLAREPVLLRQFGVRYALTSPHFLHGWDHHYLPRPEVLASMPQAHTVYTDGTRRILDLGEPVPRAYFASGTRVEWVNTREEALDRIRRLAPARVAIVETGSVTDSDSVSDSDSVTDSVTDSDSASYEVTASASGWLVINATYDEGWTAAVDGTPSRVVRANGLVRAVQVPSGTHTVALRYAPLDGILTRWLWAIGLLISLFLFFAPQRRTPKTP
jgi:hypothetical protein